MLGDIAEPVARRPAHHRAVGVDRCPGAEFPQAGVGLVVHLPRPDPDLLQRREVLDGRLAEQAFVEECLGVGQDDLAISVMLDLGESGIADPHRAHPAIAGQRRRFTLVEPRCARHCVERLDVPALRLIDDIAQIAQIIFEHVERAEPVQAPGRCNKRRGSSNSDSPSCGWNARLPGSRWSAPRRSPRFPHAGTASG